MNRTIKRIFAALLVCACAAGMTACSSPAPASDAGQSSASAPAVSAAASSASGETEWALSINTLTLDEVSFTEADLQDNVLTLLNVWGTWCPPCVGELPHLQEASEHGQDKGVQIVGVLQDGVTRSGEVDSAVVDDAKALLEAAGVTYTVILPDQTLAQEFIATMQYFPTTFFLDAQGEVVKTVVGAKSAEVWISLIDEALADAA